MSTRFLQIHTLTSYPATLLNRDDAGFAKRMPFGGGVRTRISSQCLKRHWREFEGEVSLKSIDAPATVRSRVSFQEFVVKPLLNEGVPAPVAQAAAAKIVGKVFGSEAKKKKADQARKGAKKGGEGAEVAAAAPAGAVATEQVTVLGRPELDYLCQLARVACKAAGNDPSKVVDLLEESMNEKELRKNINALKPGSLEAGLGAALFGRMVTGDILSRTDAAIHVAHAMTVHQQMTESDYFSAIDDLLREQGESGSGHLNASELTSGLFYGYLVVDVQGLLRNLGDDSVLAAKVVNSLVHIVATVSPGAKKGSTAPYSYSHLVLLESGKAQPRTLANAFLEPVDTRGNVVENAYKALGSYVQDLDKVYGRPQSEQRVHAGIRTSGHFGDESKTLDEVASWAERRLCE